jgi:hypothetical protein
MVALLQTAIDATIIVTLWVSVGSHAMAHAPATVVAPRGALASSGA